MRMKLFYIALTTGLISLSACSKLLEEKSQSEVIPSTAQDFKELLMGSGYIGSREPAAFLGLMEDDLEFNTQYPDGLNVGTNTTKMYLPAYSWQSYFANQDGLGQMIGTDPASTTYGIYYERIKGCNAVLDNIDAAIGTQAEKDRVKAEALAVRSHYYFMLVNLYGQPYNFNSAAPGVPLKLTSDIESEYPGRATVKAVYDQIVNDLKEAGRLMDPLAVARRDYHMNQPTIHTLLSRVYLHMENWEGVIEEANKVFTFGAVLADMKTFTTAPYLTYNNPEVEWLFGAMPELGDPTTYTASGELRSMFDPNDVRMKLGYVLQANVSAYMVNKYTRGSATVIQCIRTGEAVLNRAEAYAQLNKLTEAMKDLNDLRRTRIPNYVDVSITDRQNAIDAIRNERRKEFCHENFRWFDLRRYGMPSIRHKYILDKGQPVKDFVLAEKDPMYTLPFPNSVVERNTTLSQNPSATLPERVQQ